ncbi:hypothetical protein LXA43DRAFT_1062000 [Ganoderma leucocontextum]|nr:hypothetical protein LXA43DRAFT_1062000 [Ganoderma leucocontextum]
MWRKNLHRELLNAIVAAIPLGSPYTLCELVLYGLIFPTLEELVSTCMSNPLQYSFAALGRSTLVGPRGTSQSGEEPRIPHHVPNNGATHIREAGIRHGLKSTLTKLVLDVTAASNIAGSGSEVADGQTEREAEVVHPFRLAQCPFIVEPPAITDCQISKAVDSDLAKARPLLDRVVMPNADVLLRLRLEPTDVASEADLNHDASEFVQGRGAFSAVENLGPSVRGFSNFLQERHRGVVSKVSRRRV